MEYHSGVIHGLYVVHAAHVGVKGTGLVLFDILKGIGHVFGGDGLAVVPDGPLLQVEGQIQAVLGVGPVCSQIRKHVQVVIQLSQTVEDILRRELIVVIGIDVGAETRYVAVDLSNHGLTDSTSAAAAVAALAAASGGREKQNK